MDYTKLSLNLGCFSDQKTIKNTKTLHILIKNDCKGP